MREIITMSVLEGKDLYRGITAKSCVCWREMTLCFVFLLAQASDRHNVLFFDNIWKVDEKEREIIPWKRWKNVQNPSIYYSCTHTPDFNGKPQQGLKLSSHVEIRGLMRIINSASPKLSPLMSQLSLHKAAQRWIFALFFTKIGRYC